MKAYENVKIEILQIEEDIVRTSGNEPMGAEGKNGFDTIIFDFGV